MLLDRGKVWSCPCGSESFNVYRLGGIVCADCDEGQELVVADGDDVFNSIIDSVSEVQARENRSPTTVFLNHHEVGAVLSMLDLVDHKGAPNWQINGLNVEVIADRAVLVI